jgi:hypothetical protein
MPNQPVRRPWWHRVRFSLRGLMIAIAILCGWLGWSIHQARVQREAVAAIEMAGGKVMYDWHWQWKKGQPTAYGVAHWRWTRGQPIPRESTWWPEWLVSRIGIDYLFKVNYVEMRWRGSDELLDRIGQLHGLEYLNLAGSPVDNAGLAKLEGLTALQSLSLEDTRVTDAGLVHLEGLTRLETLLLSMTRVTDAGLPHLKRLTRLKLLSLFLTTVSDDAGQDLQRAMPTTRMRGTGWPGRNQARAIAISEKATKAKPEASR